MRAALLALLLAGCGGAATYQAALLRCVDQAQTLAESKACRQLVDAQYGITETASKDAGR